jgi:hypothetical protein
VITYDDSVRAVLVKSLLPFNIQIAICATFCEAQDACGRDSMPDTLTLMFICDESFTVSVYLESNV